MKKRIIFELLALLTVAGIFFALYKIQDMDMHFSEILDEKGKEVLVDTTLYEDLEYNLKQEEVISTLEKQEFFQPLNALFVNCYYYSKLSEEEKVVYTEIYNILDGMEKDVELSTLDTDLIEKIFKCVLNDHPEFYYVEGYTYTTYTRKEKVVKLELSGTYTKTEEECRAIDEKIDLYKRQCFDGITADMTDYERVKHIYEYIIHHTEYNLLATDNQNICSVFVYGESVCMGYAKAMQYLLLQQNILCTIVNGTASQGEEHAWNLLLLDGQYYHLDVTWGDDSYTVTNPKDSQVGMINYGFFCVTTEEISKSHQIKNIVELPECIAVENNYYVKEGYYLTSLDLAKIGQIFEQAYNENKDHVEMKCSDSLVYEQVYGYLIEEHNIFEYLKNEKSTVSYYDGGELLLLEFWLK